MRKKRLQQIKNELQGTSKRGRGSDENETSNKRRSVR